MTGTGAFSDEEWALVAEGPVLAGLVVMFAERGGTVRETIAITQAYAQAREHEQTTELLREVVAHAPRLDQSRFSSSDQLAADGVARLREAVALVARTGTEEEPDDYKTFVRWLAEQVARAHREGSVLGFGGTAVTPNELEALDHVARALGLSPRHPPGEREDG